MIIPEPKQYRNIEGRTPPFHSFQILDETPFGARELLEQKLWDHPVPVAQSGFAVAVKLEEEQRDRLFKTQGYRLTVGEDGVQIRCGAREGLLHAFSTLKQLLTAEEEGSRLELCEITDWPSVENRSVSGCLTWYSGYGRIGFDMQLFSYEEWLEFLNVCADLKINQWNLCLYGYWPFRMEQYPESEFRDVRVRLYNAETDRFFTTTFTHPNLAEEFLTRLIGDAHRLGVRVYAYMGLNSYSGGYPCVHKEKRMQLPDGSPYFNDFDRMCFSRQENVDYFLETVRQVVRLGFDGIDFEESEEAGWFCDCEDCRRNFKGKTPEEALAEASFALLQQAVRVAKEENPDCVIGLRAFRQQPLVKSAEEMERIKAIVPEDVVFFWAPGLYVPEGEFDKWIEAFGKERIVGRDTESNGIAACFGRLVRTFRSNGLQCEKEPLQQYIEEDVRQHIGSAQRGVKGTNGFLFEWYGFFLHLMVHANYPWGGTMPPEQFYQEATEWLYGKEYAADILFALQNMLTIHQSQLAIFPQSLPFAVHKVAPEDLPAIERARRTNGEIVEKLERICGELKHKGASHAKQAHLQKLLCANQRNRLIYDMALIDLKLQKISDPAERRPLLQELARLNEAEFELVKRNYFDVSPMDATGVKSCMMPYHELKRVIQNELDPAHADPEMIYLGVEALGWM